MIAWGYETLSVAAAASAGDSSTVSVVILVGLLVVVLTVRELARTRYPYRSPIFDRRWGWWPVLPLATVVAVVFVRQFLGFLH